MEIIISQREIPISKKYIISVDGHDTYSAIQSHSLFRQEIFLYKTDESERPRIKITNKQAWFKATYDIVRWDNNTIQFRTKSVWRLSYYCSYGHDTYFIIGHRGRRFSIFRNKKQVAWWEKNILPWVGSYKFIIYADRDSDIDLVISFCLIIDNYFDKDTENNTLHYDLGNIGCEERPFDLLWRPK